MKLDFVLAGSGKVVLCKADVAVVTICWLAIGTQV